MPCYIDKVDLFSFLSYSYRKYEDSFKQLISYNHNIVEQDPASFLQQMQLP